MTETISPDSSTLGPDGPRSILKEIERPYTKPIILERGGDAAIINGDFIVRFKKLRSGRPWLIIFRDKSIPISWDGDSPLIPYPNTDELKGEIAALGVSARDDRRETYVGEEYELTYRPDLSADWKSAVEIVIRSTRPIEEPRFVNPEEDLEGLLKKLSAKAA